MEKFIPVRGVCNYSDLSIKFFSRLGRELPELFGQLEQWERREFDEEVEKISKMDCDLAAEVLDRKRFKEVAEQAFWNLKKRKQEIPTVA